MKKLTLFTLSVLFALCARSQVAANDPVKTGKRFYVGVSYLYMSIDQKLSSLSLHSEWYGEDYGTYDLSDEEIDEVNSIIDRSTAIHDINLEAGMSFIKNQDSKWHFNGKIFFGIAGNDSEVSNNATDTLEYSFNSGLSRPAFGLGLDAGYHFNDRWALSLRPIFMGTMGKNTDIVDNIGPDPVNVTENTDDQYFTYYEHVSLTADFTAGAFTISVGPGFYWISSKHQYTITRTNDLNGELMIDEITSITTGKSFIDGNVAIEWRIIDPLTFYAAAGIGSDLFIDTGLHYNF